MSRRSRGAGRRGAQSDDRAHAGYVYSGSTAAAAFGTLRDARAIERVVVIGPAHYVGFRGIAVPYASAFATPLGRTRSRWSCHFLQVLLPSFRIVPLVVGDAEPPQVAEVLRRLWGGAETLIVVSSDLSHYHDYDTARRLDGETAELIERGAGAEIGAERACGWLAVAGLLIALTVRGGTARRLALCNSGDTAGPRDRVVGYGAWRIEQATA